MTRRVSAGALKSPLLSNQDEFATILNVSESPIHRLSYAVLFMSIIVVFAEKSGGKVQGQTPRQNAASPIFDKKFCVRKSSTLWLSHTLTRL